MKTRQLPVSFFDVTTLASYGGKEFSSAGAPPPMELLAHCLSAPNVPMQRGNVRKTIEQWIVDGSHRHTILVNRADRDRTDVAFVDFRNGRRRAAGKTPNDGLEFSCHIMIVPPKPGQVFPMMLATGGAGMSRDEIQNTLNIRLRHAMANPEIEKLYCKPHPSGAKGKTLKLRCKFEVLPHTSLLLQDILKKGLLNEVQLIQHEIEGLDQNFIQKAHSITLSVAKEGQPIMLSQLKQAIGLAKIHPDQLVVKFRDVDTGQTASKTLALNELEKALTKRDVIQLDSDLYPSYTDFNREILRKLTELI